MSDFDGASESPEVGEISESSIDTTGETGGESSIDTQEEIDFEGSESGFDETEYDSDIMEENYDKSETDGEIGFDEDIDNISVDDEVYSDANNLSSDEEGIGFSEDDIEDSEVLDDEIVEEDIGDYDDELNESDETLDDEIEDESIEDEESIDDSDGDLDENLDDESIEEDIEDFDDELNESDETLDDEIEDESIEDEKIIDDSDGDLDENLDDESIEEDIEDFDDELNESDETLDDEIEDESIEDEKIIDDLDEDLDENLDNESIEDDIEDFDETLDDEIEEESIEDDETLDDSDGDLDEKFDDKIVEDDADDSDESLDEEIDGESIEDDETLDNSDEELEEAPDDELIEDDIENSDDFDEDLDKSDETLDSEIEDKSIEDDETLDDTDKELENDIEDSNDSNENLGEKPINYASTDSNVQDSESDSFEQVDTKNTRSESVESNETQGKRNSFQDWLNPDSYKDGKYTGEYRPNGMTVEQYNKQQTEKAKTEYAEYLKRHHMPQTEKNDAYAEYTDKLDDNLETQQSDVPEEKNSSKSYDEYCTFYENNQLEHIEKENSEIKIVSSNDIYGVDPSGERFWNHHGNTKEDYVRIAEKLPEVQEKLDAGLTVDEIKKNPELADCVNAYYDQDKMVKVEQYGDAYIFQDDGRHRVAAAQELGYEVPVNVTYEAKSLNDQQDGFDSGTIPELQPTDELKENTEEVGIEDDGSQRFSQEDLNDLPPKNETDSNEYNSIVNALEQEKVEYRPIQLAELGRSQQDIISNLSGGDETKGSCSSLALAYAGNKAGYEVLDFRDGNSRSYFSSRDSIQKIADMPDIKSSVLHGTNDIETANQLLSGMQNGKEYYLATGGHAAIVRKSDAGYEYLELQHPSNGNGWHTLDDETLHHRFGCNESRTSACSSFLMDVDSMTNSSEFLNVLGFINTAENEQRKGATGNVK